MKVDLAGITCVVACVTSEHAIARTIHDGELDRFYTTA